MLRPYSDMEIKNVGCTMWPDELITMACNITQKKDIHDFSPKEKIHGSTSLSDYNEKLYKFLIRADHTSVFEHAVIHLLIRKVSRSLMAQLTRHRMASYTIASQHYQIYDDFDDMVLNTNDDIKEAIDASNERYKFLIERNVPREEARQVLPGSKAVNILWTINARSLLNFFRHRLCFRNVFEMRLFAENTLQVCKQWWPSFFDLMGPPCVMDGRCNQGYMRCSGLGVTRQYGKVPRGGILGFH